MCERVCMWECVREREKKCVHVRVCVCVHVFHIYMVLISTNSRPAAFKRVIHTSSNDFSQCSTSTTTSEHDK